MGQVTTTYLPPLRGAVLWAMGLDAGAIDAATIARVASTSEHRAKAFASILVNHGALVETISGYARGPRWSDWSATPSRARPHQTVAPEVQDEAATVRRNIAEAVTEWMRVMGLNDRALATKARIPHQYVVALRTRHVTPPAWSLLLIARAMGTTIEDLAASPAQMHT